MALNDDAVFAAASGYILTGAVDAAPPTEQNIFDYENESSVLTSFTVIGHTSRDDLPEIGFDGGDTEARGSWQKQTLRTVQTDTPVEFVDFNLIQFDAATLALYYGSPNTGVGATYSAAGNLGGKTDVSLVVVLVDGSNKIAFYASNAELGRNDAITMATDDFAVLPMRATVLDPVSPVTQPKISWIPGVATP